MLKNNDVTYFCWLSHCWTLLGIARYFWHALCMPRQARAASPEQWARLADRINERLRAHRLLLSQLSNPPSRSVWSHLANGNPPSGRVAYDSLWDASRELGWSESSAEAVLDGGEPQVVGPPRPIVKPDIYYHEARLVRLEALVGLRPVDPNESAEETAMRAAALSYFAGRVAERAALWQDDDPPAEEGRPRGEARRESRKPRRRAE